MRIKFDNLPKEAVDLIKLMGSKDTLKSREAQEAFAALLSPRIGQVLQQVDTTTLVYRDLQFNEDDDPTFPLNIFNNSDENELSIWSQGTAGGLPTNEIYSAIQEVRFTTYRLDSAYHYSKKYARKARLDVIQAGIQKLMQEILLKTSTQAWSVLLAALGGASHGGRQHVFRAATANSFTMKDLNAMFTRIRRLNQSWASGTPAVGTGKLTDIVMSPEIKEMIRAFAYEPVNVAQTTQTVTLPEGERAAMWRGAGANSIFDVNIIELNEFGVSQKYNTLFGTYAGATTYADIAGNITGTFSGANEELVLGLDLTQDFAYKASAVNPDVNSTFTLTPDDQFVNRSDKIGAYGNVEEGRLVLKTEPMVGWIV